VRGFHRCAAATSAKKGRRGAQATTNHVYTVTKNADGPFFRHPSAASRGDANRGRIQIYTEKICTGMFYMLCRTIWRDVLERQEVASSFRNLMQRSGVIITKAQCSMSWQEKVCRWQARELPEHEVPELLQFIHLCPEGVGVRGKGCRREGSGGMAANRAV